MTLLLKLIALKKRLKKNYETVPDSSPILGKTLANFIKSKEEKNVEILVEIYKSKENQAVQLSFKSTWRKMERVDKIESLVSMEKELAGYRNDLCQELMDFSKGKW